MMGKEIRSLLEKGPWANSEISFLDSAEFEGVLTKYCGEARPVTAIEKESFIHSDIIFLCCRRRDARRYFSFPRKKRSFIIDFSMAAIEDNIAPVVNCNVNVKDIKKHSGIISSPHPITMTLTNLLYPLDQAFGVQYASANVLRPVSDLGEKGIEELYHQTVHILNFNEVPKSVFKNQLVFNLIPDFSVVQELEEKGFDTRIGEEIPAILGWETKKLAIRMLLVPVFHCHSFSLHINFQGNITRADIADVLSKQEWIRYTARKDAEVTPVGIAGRQEIHVSNLFGDGLSPRGFWLWSVSDNLLSGCASNAIKIAEYSVSYKLSSIDKRRKTKNKEVLS